MIGLVDLTLQSWDKPQLCPPNLEIMKLATYYQTEENTFCRLINLDETELTTYEKIYIFSEFKDYINVPETFKRAPNVIYGGTAFTNNKYVPFDNPLIDYTIAKPTIYKDFLKDKYTAGLKEIEIIRLLENSYFRWHAGTKELPLPAIRKKRRIYIYDRDFFNYEWRPMIKKIINRNPSSIQFIHPIHYNHISDFLDVRENQLIAKGNDTFLDLNIPLSETPILMKHYKNRLLAAITKSSQVYLSLGGSFYYSSNYIKDIFYKLNLLYTFWSCNIPIKIKYEEPDLGCYNPISDLSKLIASWTQGDTSKIKCIAQRVPKDRRATDPHPVREQIKMLLDKYPEHKILFQQTTESVKTGGLWHGHRYDLG